MSDVLFRLSKYARHRPWCPEANGPGDCTCGLYALLDSIRCTCGHKVSVHTDRDVDDVVGWPCSACKSKRCTGFTPEATAPDHEHQWVDGWQKAGPSYRWTETQQWPDDVPTRACRVCGPESGFGWVSADWATPEATAPDRTADPGGLQEALTADEWQRVIDALIADGLAAVSRRLEAALEATAPDTRE
jgi:hypothetical protein